MKTVMLGPGLRIDASPHRNITRTQQSDGSTHLSSCDVPYKSLSAYSRELPFSKKSIQCPGSLFCARVSGQKTGQQFGQPSDAVEHEERFGGVAFRYAVRRSLLTERHAFAGCACGCDFVYDYEKILWISRLRFSRKFANAEYVFVEIFCSEFDSSQAETAENTREIFLASLSEVWWHCTDFHEKSLLINIFSLPVALRPNAGHGLLILEVSRSHTTTHHSR